MAYRHIWLSTVALTDITQVKFYSSESWHTNCEAANPKKEKEKEQTTVTKKFFDDQALTSELSTLKVTQDFEQWENWEQTQAD